MNRFYVMVGVLLAVAGCTFMTEDVGSNGSSSVSCSDDASGFDASALDAAEEVGLDAAFEAASEAGEAGVDAAQEASVDAGPSTTTLFALGTGLGGSAAPDGMVEQALGHNGVFQLLPFPRSNGYMAGTAWEPTTAQFYEFGNTDGSNPAQQYSPSTNAWTNLFNLPGSNEGGEGCVGAAGGLLQIMGGFSNKAAAIASVYSYNPVKQTYTAKSALPTAVGDCFAVTIGSLVYHGGGCSNNDGPGTKATCQKTFYSYDPVADVHTALPAMPAALGQAGSVLFNGSIYLVGGYLGPAGQTVGTTGVYAYNLAAGTWSQKNPFPIAVADACVANYQGTLYALGGFTAAGFPSATKNVYEYNAAADSWSLAPFALTTATGVSACGPAPYPKGF